MLDITMERKGCQYFLKSSIFGQRKAVFLIKADDALLFEKTKHF